MKNKRKRGNRVGVIVLTALTLLAVVLGGIFVFAIYSPWPAVWLLRSGKDGAAAVPKDFDALTEGIIIKKDLPYPSKWGKNNFDLYLPPEKESGVKTEVPLVLWVHGGAFVAGDKSGISGWASLLAARGYAVAAMNYQWAPEAAWPAQAMQVSECLKELRRLSQNGTLIDMENIFLAGDSAGAHIAAQAAEAGFNEEFSEQTGIKIDLGKNGSALKGLLLYCGPYELEAFSKIENKTLRFFMDKVGQSFVGTRQWKKSEKTRYLNVIPWMTKACPPVYITDGNSGSFESQGKNLARALQEMGVVVQTRFFDPKEGNIGHEYQMDLTTAEGLACFMDTQAFLEKYKN